MIGKLFIKSSGKSGFVQGNFDDFKNLISVFSGNKINNRKSERIDRISRIKKGIFFLIL